jgi:lipopolysaccharide/colanic/teichoic acid biosynthesis glycosyltransferase
MVGAMAVIIYAFRLFYISRFHVFGTFFLFVFMEIILYYLYFISRIRQKGEEDIETLEELDAIMEQERVHYDFGKRETTPYPVHPVKEKLKNDLLKSNPHLYEFINDKIDIQEIDKSDTTVFNTHTIYNVETIDDNSLRLFVNLHRVNDIRWINRYMLEIHKKLVNCGYFIGRIDTIDTYKKSFFEKYPRYLAEIFYVLNFIFVRVFPKLPGIKTFYFAVTKGRNRMISRAEILGRIYFCGFKIIAEKEINDSLYFIAQKLRRPSMHINPSYGPIVKMKRIGFAGDIIYINKFRTMHPYSEYLQKYVFKQTNLQSDGKIKDDFRVTEWGKIFRRHWIDELPQFIDFLRGDLNLIGVRALSVHFFCLYPKDLQKLRVQFKPGLIPPYYADMPNSFEEIIESEKRYLIQKQQRPFLTDFKYFFKAVYNIVFKNARSG